MKSVLFTAMDGGGFGSIAPLEGLVKEFGYETEWVVDEKGVAKTKLQSKNKQFSVYPATAAGFKNVAAVVAAVSSKPGADYFLAKEAAIGGIPVVKILDFWGTGQPHEKGFAPDRLCVLDQPSVSYETRMRAMSPENIRVTGDPKMDLLTKVDTKTYSANRQKLRIEDNQIFIAFFGPGSQSRSDEIFYPFVDALPESDFAEDVVMGVMLHPKSNPQNYEDAYYEHLTKSGLKYRQDDKMRLLGDTSNITVAADLVVGSTSTELISSCYLRRPTLNIIPLEGANYKEFFEPRNFSELTLPSVECGAALLATDQGQIAEHLNDLFWDWPDSLDVQSDLAGAQEKHYNLDGKNTERAFAALKEVL